MSSLNFVKFYFIKGVVPKERWRINKLLALAYQTVTEHGVVPKAILVRSGWHPTMSSRMDGAHVIDPDGGHYTFASKDDGYTPDKDSFDLIKSKIFATREDSIIRKTDKPLWPEFGLKEFNAVAYCHLGGEEAQVTVELEDAEVSEEVTGR